MVALLGTHVLPFRKERLQRFTRKHPFEFPNRAPGQLLQGPPNLRGHLAEVRAVIQLGLYVEVIDPYLNLADLAQTSRHQLRGGQILAVVHHHMRNAECRDGCSRCVCMLTHPPEHRVALSLSPLAPIHSLEAPVDVVWIPPNQDHGGTGWIHQPPPVSERETQPRVLPHPRRVLFIPTKESTVSRQDWKIWDSRHRFLRDRLEQPCVVEWKAGSIKDANVLRNQVVRFEIAERIPIVSLADEGLGHASDEVSLGREDPRGHAGSRSRHSDDDYVLAH